MYLPISLEGLSVSLPQLYTPKRFNVLTLIATLGIGISLFTELAEGCSIQIPERPHLSISDTQQNHANVGQTSPCKQFTDIKQILTSHEQLNNIKYNSLIHAIVTGFNKTLDMNLEHTGCKYTSVQSIKHHHSFRKEEKYKNKCLLH